MSVRMICNHDPWLFMDRVEQDPFRKGERDLRESHAVHHLLEQSILKLGLNFSDYVLGRAEIGKPYFVKQDTEEDIWVPEFSLSHCGEYVVCAISREEVGCDMERIRPVSRYLDSELEKVRRIRIQNLYKENERAETVRLWTVYESIAKCTGMGIPVKEGDIAGKPWEIRSWIIDRKYIVSTVQRR